MANELQLTISATYTKNGESITPPGVTGQYNSVNGNNVSRGIMATSTTPAAIPLNGIVTIGWIILKNLDAVNSISIQDASSGHTFANLGPGIACCVPAGSSVTAPYATASAGTPLLDFFITPT